MHAYFLPQDGHPSTLEALVYDMPFGLFFRKAVLWHQGKEHVFRHFQESRRDPKNLEWVFRCFAGSGLQLEVTVDGRGPGVHRLPYAKTDCTGNFCVVNNSLASAAVCLEQRGSPAERLATTNGAALEMTGRV